MWLWMFVFQLSRLDRILHKKYKILIVVLKIQFLIKISRFS